MSGFWRARWMAGSAVIGAMTIALPIAPRVEAATYVVNDTRDRVDTRPGNGVCRTSSGTCSLRAAVQEANARAGADVITLRAGTYMITRAPLNDNDVTTGDLDVTGPLTINGAGAATTLVDGGTSPAGSDASRTALDRVFEIHPGAGDVTLSGLTVREGWDAKEGGAIASRTVGTLRLLEASVIDSFAGTAGGGIFVDGFGGGSLVIENSTVARNSTSGEGGGVHLASGRLIVAGIGGATTTITGNSARNGGGIYNSGLADSTGQLARVSIADTTISANTALLSGAGIANQLEGHLSLVDAAVAGNVAADDGGGIASGSKTSLAVTRTTFSANQTEGSGGGVFTRTEGDVSVEGSSFVGNSSGSLLVPELAGDGGGAIAVYGSGEVSISTSRFDGNASSGDGGGIAVHSDGPVALNDLVVTGNRSGASGGGILASGRVVDIVGLVVTHNVAAEQGGGIDNQGSGEFAIADTTVASNVAASGGGFSNRADSTLRVVRSTFSDNHATVAGGGFMHESDAATEIENTTLSGNSAGLNGGGLYLDADAGLHIANTTITANTAPYGSGVGTADAIDNFPVASHPLLLFRNTIIAGNVGGPDCHAAFGSEGGNLDGGTLCNFSGPRDRASVDPRLEPLADNGGLTRTHALAAFSPAIGGGVAPCAEVDQRGAVRELDRACDIGSYEYAGSPEPPPPDTSAPDTRLDSGPSDTTPNTDATFAFSSDSPGATFECALDGAPFAACASPVGLAGLATGIHHFGVRAVDATGSVDPTPASYTWLIDEPPDATAPNTFIDSGPPAVTESRDTDLTFSADEIGASFECSLDGTAYVACASPAAHRGLVDGLHTFAVRATDAAGNQDPTPATHTWTVAPPPDQLPPDTTIDSAPPVLTESVDATFVFSASEQGSTFVCAVDSTSFNACTSPVQFAGLSVGVHTFTVRATDPAGNDDPVPASHVWIVQAPRDTAPPETDLASAPASPTTSTSAQFTFSSSESSSSFECSLDGFPFAPCGSPVSYNGLAAGDHTFEVRAIDPAGNVDATPESYTWTIEGPPPPPPPVEVSFESGPASPTTETTARFVFSASRPGARLECALDDSPFLSCTSPVSIGALSLGDHTFDVRATDSNGNSDTARYTWRIDAPQRCTSEVSIAASADAWIDENSPNSNKGNDSVLKVQSKAPRDNFRGLVRFPIPPAPDGCVVVSATMSLYAGSAATGRNLHVLRVATAWSEEGVTWANQPATLGMAVAAESRIGFVAWDVTSTVTGEEHGVHHGFLIRDDEGGDGFEQQFFSREKERPPTLVITYAPAG